MARPITQQITFLDPREPARTSDFYARLLGLGLGRDPNGYLVEIQRFREPPE